MENKAVFFKKCLSTGCLDTCLTKILVITTVMLVLKCPHENLVLRYKLPYTTN